MIAAVASAAATLSACCTPAGLLPQQRAALALLAAVARSEVFLSDEEGVDAVLLSHDPDLDADQLVSARRIATDVVQGGFLRLVKAAETALARAERVAEHATGDEAHAALAEITDWIAAVLGGLALGGRDGRMDAGLELGRRVS